MVRIKISERLLRQKLQVGPVGLDNLRHDLKIRPEITYVNDTYRYYYTEDEYKKLLRQHIRDSYSWYRDNWHSSFKDGIK